MPRLIADLLRVLAILGVITIHATDAWRLVPGLPMSPGDWAAVIVDQACRFCVPLFVVLSGYALGKRYGRDPAFITKDFLVRRASRIGVPYLLWSLLNLVVLTLVGITFWAKSPADAFTNCLHDSNNQPIGLLHWFAIGGADYHLYFLPIILQCYVAFPLLRQWRASLISVAGVASALVAWTLYQEGTRVFAWPWPGLWSTFPLPWLLLFQLGCWIADDDIALARFVRRIPSALVLMLLISGPLWCLVDWWWVSTRGIQGAGDFSRPAAPWYAIVVVFAAVRWGPQWEQRISTLSPIITTLALSAFATYLAHTWVLRGLEALGLKLLGRVCWIPIALWGSLLIGHALHRAASRWQPFRWLIGG